ncbi:MAG: hypothetical protein QXY96_06400 [Candidatus Methanomethylicaceae archaeon]
MNDLNSKITSLSSNLFDAKELFTLLLDLRELAELWLKARKGLATKEEKKQLGKKVKELAEKLDIFPFHGFFLKYLLPKKPTILPKWIKIPYAVDNILNLTLEYLTYRCDHVIWEDISSNPRNINAYLKENSNRFDDAIGYIFEVIIRRWLKEVIGKHWCNVQQLLVPLLPRHKPRCIPEIDAVSILKVNNYYHISAAEIKWTLTRERALGTIEEPTGVLEKFTQRLQVLNDHFIKYIKAKIYFPEIAIIAGNTLGYGQKRELNEKLQKNIFRLQPRLNCRRENIKIYDMNDILETLEKRQNSIKSVIEHIKAIRYT